MKRNADQLLLRKSHSLIVKCFLVGIFLLFRLNASAQERTISGTVTGTDNEPVIGATVLVQGASVGTLTDLNGKFTLSISPAAKTLIFSFVGMDPKEIAISATNVYNVVLTESTVGLEEVVVIGYGTQKRISVTGAIVSVESDFLVKNPSATVANSLSGRVTGLTTVQYSGQPGADAPDIYVRGIGSLTTSASRPLMLVDGVERSFTQLDPNEIESISVLKDASATAVYGIRGANGVIIVTTKRGIEGAPRISVSSSTGLQIPTKLVDMADSYQYALYHNATTLSDDPTAAVKFTPDAIKAFKAGGTLIYPNTDWDKYLTKPAALQTQHNINITGGSRIVKYFVSFGYLNQSSMFKTLGTEDSYSFGFQRFNYRSNIDLDITKSTKLSLTIGGRSELRQNTGNAASFTNLYWAVPYSGMVHEGKRIVIGNFYIGGSEKKDGLEAIGWGSGYARDLDNVMNFDIGLRQELEFVSKGLSWRFKVSNNNTISHDKTRSTSKATYDPYYKCDTDPAAIGDSTIVFRRSGSDGLLGYSESGSKSRNWYFETAFAYDRSFGKHNITGLLLYNGSKSYYPGTNSDIATGYVGLAARGTYNYRSRYLFDFNLGYNGSENFAPDKRFGLFPAFSVGWVPTEENFLKGKIAFLDYMKIRISYGIVGNDNQGGNRFLYLPDSYNASDGSYSFGTITTSNRTAASEGKVGNPDVTWERSRKQNYGIDLKFLSGKLGVTGDYFYEYRNNILTTRNTVAVMLAYELPAINLGKVQNQGFELELKWRTRVGSQFNYYLTANTSFARNKIIFMDEIPKTEDYLIQTGQRVNQRFVYQFDGFWTQDDIDHLSDFPDAAYIPKPGDARYKDLNGDNVINAFDQKATGYPDYPEYNFSLAGGFEWKGLDFSMLWNGVTNASRQLSDTWRVAFADVGDRALLLWLAENSWTPETASTAFLPRMSFTGRINNSRTSDLWLRDASYIRLKNLEVGYSINTTFLKRLGISRVRCYTNAYNVLTFSYFKFIDPEARTSSPDYPLVRIVNLGINVTF